MKISRTTEYALRTMVHLAQKAQRCTAQEISEANDIPIKYFQKISQALAQKDLLIITRGKFGGFELAKDVRSITLLDIISSTQELDSNPHVCRLYGLSCHKKKEPCSCILRDTLLKLEQEERRLLNSVTLEDIALGDQHCCPLEVIENENENEKIA